LTIEIPGYTEEEKIEIARKFIIPRQIKEHGLTDKLIVLPDETVKKIISEHTREAGLRNLEREVATVCRKVAKQVASGKKETTAITPKTLSEYLGVPRYLPEAEQEADEVGVATGLAWTPVGGEILYVEATTMKGKGQLTLTGHLGDVMKESAQAALSYARSMVGNFGLPSDFYKDLDIHIHVPAGAIPKDGPSAGVTMAAALVSVLTQTPVNKDMAMTGEITLRGRVLPVGGIKEKCLAALRAGSKTIIIPDRNKKDLEEVPGDVRKKMNIVMVKHVDEVLELALKKKPKRARKRAKPVRRKVQVRA
jgi:ATP-dependent Lon protease